MTVHASFAKELAGLQNCDHRFLALLGHDSKLDLASLNVKNRVRHFALLEHVLVLVKFEDRFPRAHLGEKRFGVKHLLDWLAPGTSFGSTNFPDFGLLAGRRPFRLSRALPCLIRPPLGGLARF